MRSLIRAITAAALLCASISQAAVTQSTHTTYQVRRGSSNLSPAPTSKAECVARAYAAADAEAEWRTSGANDHQCHEVLHILQVYRPNPPAPVCPERSAEQTDEQEPRTCPAGTVGTWLQDRVYTLHDYPTCWTQGDWTPAEPPAGMCAPIDSDADGVPDSRDQCPTVHALTPDGCPATPPPNRAPTIAGSLGNGTVGVDYFFRPTASDPEGGALTFSIAGAPSWMTFRSLDGRITGRPSVAATHTGIVISVRDPAGNTASLPPATVTITGGAVPTNRAPTITGTPAPEVTAGAPYDFQPSGADADGNALTYSIVNRPSWATFAASSGRLSGTPAVANVGVHSGIAVSVSDGIASASLPPFSITVTQTVSGSVLVGWTPPTQNTDGSSLTNLAGYRIGYGTSPNALTQTIQVSNPGVSSHTISDLSPGTYYFAVRAYTSGGNESANSNVASRTVQ